MILIRANTERQIPVIRATLVSAPLASASKYVYAATYFFIHYPHASELKTVYQNQLSSSLRWYRRENTGEKRTVQQQFFFKLNLHPQPA